MKRKLILTIACSALFVLAASGQDAGQTSAKFNESNAYVLEGRRLLDANKPEEALKAFQQAAQLNPGNWRAVTGQYDSLVKLKRENEATKIPDDFLVNLVAANPGDPQIWLGKAFAEAESNQPEKALKPFTKLTELEPNNGGYWDGRGQMLETLKRYDEALKAFDKAITLDPKDAQSWNDRGNVLLQLGKYDDSIKSLRVPIDAFLSRSRCSRKASTSLACRSLNDNLETSRRLRSEANRRNNFQVPRYEYTV